MDFRQENERKDEELGVQLHVQRKSQIAGADIAGEAQLHTARYAAKANALQIRAQMEAQQEAMPQQEAAPQQLQQPEAPPQQGEGGRLPPAVASLGSQLSTDSMAPGGGMDLATFARKAAAYLRRIGEENGEQAKHRELERLQLEDPNLYRLVIPFLNDSGSKEDPTNALQNPAPGGQKDMSRAIG